MILEGIFVLLRLFRARYNLAVWIEGSFDTALRRAWARNQDAATLETRQHYSTVYFPAQRFHLRRDQPRAAAEFVLDYEIDTVRSDERVISRAGS